MSDPRVRTGRQVTPAYVRWRIERLEELLRQALEALEALKAGKLSSLSREPVMP